MIGLFKGLHATISHLMRHKVTVQYPEERRGLPERSRGLIRLRLKPGSYEPRCISCTFCEQVCPATAIKVIYEQQREGKVWALDAGAGLMLSHLLEGDSAIGGNGWREGVDMAAPRGACFAESLMYAGEITPRGLARTARRDGVSLAQAYGIATFYRQLGPGVPDRTIVEPTPEAGTTVEDCPPILLGGHGRLDPESIDDYSATGGYESVTRSLMEMTPDQTIETIAVSGLRDRGGSGGATAAKWRRAASTESLAKYIVCNAGEDDRESFKDRSLLEHNPHAIIEGMIVAGYATGAARGLIYIDASFALAEKRIRLAIDQARDRGLLGRELPGTGFKFNVKVVSIPRALVGSEETALVATLESRRPMPSPRPPWPSGSGLRQRPTVIENAETLATVSWIISHGAKEFSGIGPRHAPGTRLYTLSGAVDRPGLYEATMDITLKRLVEGPAGGFTGTPKAALVGGAGGGFLSPGLFGIPLDFDAMAEAGGDLGSGAIVVYGQDSCIVEAVRECLSFTSSESCGKCTPCRLGLRRLLDIVERVSIGEAREGDLETAAELARDIADSALCSLGRGAVRPLLTALDFFRDEFVQHMREGKCPAGRCSL